MSDTNKTVVISGATKGLGRELALEFGLAGYHVIGLYRSDDQAAADLSSEFESKRLSADFIRQDITAGGAWPEVERAIATSRLRDFTLILNASASFTPKPLHLIESHELKDLLDVNVIGTLNLLRLLLPVMASARSGVVISVLSSALKERSKGFSAYRAAKRALQALTESASDEYSGRGIGFLCVSPGFMETSLTKGWSAHLKASMNVTDALRPSTVASRILAIANDRTLPARGEIYSIDESLLHAADA